MNLADHIRRNFVLVLPNRMDEPDTYTVDLKVGGQQFCVTTVPCDTQDEARWMADQLATALANMV